jgi:probable phosphoglycerate mutase
VTTFFLVRHGVTPETGKKLTGWTPGVHLSETGVAQARAAGEYLADKKIRAIYSSPIDRTRDTADEIAERLSLPVTDDEQIGEIHFGSWTNRSLKQLATTKLWKTVQSYPSGARFPDGESLREAQARSVGELERLRGAHPKKSLCVVSHADLIKLITAHYLGMHLDQFQRIHIAPASITTIAVDDAGPMIVGVNHVPYVVGQRS